MARTYKLCTDWNPELGAHRRVRARTGIRASSEEVATKERVDNVRIVPIDSILHRRPGAVRIPLPSGPTRMRAAVERMKLWENGRRLRVKFLDGESIPKEKVARIAKEWEAISNLKLDFVTSGASEIRVSFAEKGFSWSTVGTDALTVGSSEATMNFGWLEPNTSIREYNRVVRHEFGHALGMIHEHQNPAAQGQIPWDKPKVYAYYAQQGWSHADTDANIFQLYSEDSTNHTAFDPTSIMEYAIPDSLTIGSYDIGWNEAISPMDIEFMRRQYPSGSPGTVELTVNGPRVNADIATSGEVDSYHFDVPKAVTHIMTTEGTTDTVLTLHGPNDSGAILTWDDDRGRGRNARIVRKLFPGSYWLSVRHKDPSAIGAYTISITTRKSSH